MATLNVSIGIAFLAGLASFLSPCVLSLVPAYISYLGGRAAGGEANEKRRWLTFFHGVFFTLGFSVVFVLFTIIGSALGLVFFDLRYWLAKIGGIVIILFGLHMTGIFRIPFLEYDLRIHKPVDKNVGFLSSALMGVFFSAGWSPCIGPTLGLILTFAVNSGNVAQGSLLGIAYSTGLAIPFLLAAIGVNWVVFILRKYSKVMRITEIAMGILMVVLGILLLFGFFNVLASFTPLIDLGI